MLIVFLLFFIVEGEGGGGQCFRFSPRYMKRWKEEGGKGLIGFSGNVFFIVERLWRGSMGVIFFTNSLWDGGKGAPGV